MLNTRLFDFFVVAFRTILLFNSMLTAVQIERPFRTQYTLVDSYSFLLNRCFSNLEDDFICSRNLARFCASSMLQ